MVSTVDDRLAHTKPRPAREAGPDNEPAREAGPDNEQAREAGPDNEQAREAGPECEVDMASYHSLIPTVLDSGPRGERAFDIYSLLLRERIVFLGQEVDDQIAKVMIHQGSSRARGAPRDMEIQLQEALATTRRMAEILAHHTHQPIERVEHDIDRDFYMTAEEARGYGIVDDIIAPRRGVAALAATAAT
jgi:hypothetical protein